MISRFPLWTFHLYSATPAYELCISPLKRFSWKWVAANKEATESRVPSGKVKVIAWKFFRSRPCFAANKEATESRVPSGKVKVIAWKFFRSRPWLFRQHFRFPYLKSHAFSFVTYNWVHKKNKTIGVINGAGTAYPPRSTGLILFRY